MLVLVANTSYVRIIVCTGVVASFGVLSCHKKINRFFRISEAGLRLDNMGTVYLPVHFFRDTLS